MCVYRTKNKIKGNPLEFGNKEQIKWLQRSTKCFEGDPVCDAVEAIYSDDSESEVYLEFKCIVCDRKVQSHSYKDEDLLLDNFICGGESIKCGCGQEYIVDYDEDFYEYIYVKNRKKEYL